MTDLTKPVQTRDGRKARIVSTALSNESYPVGAVITDAHGCDTFETFTSDGRYAATVNDPRPHDLVNIPVERVAFAALFGTPGNGGVKLGMWRADLHRVITDKRAAGPHTGTLKLTYRDGEAFAAEIIRREVSLNEFDPLGLG